MESVRRLYKGCAGFIKGAQALRVVVCVGSCERVSLSGAHHQTTRMAEYEILPGAISLGGMPVYKHIGRDDYLYLHDNNKVYVGSNYTSNVVGITSTAAIEPDQFPFGVQTWEEWDGTSWVDANITVECTINFSRAGGVGSKAHRGNRQVTASF